MSEPSPADETSGADDLLLAELTDDFLRRRRVGERPSVEEYAAKHPHLADRIRDLFPAMLLVEHDAAPPAERVGATIGRYKLLERIGEGGFGVVYMAEQLAPVRRKVALKVIKPGVDTRQVIARFEAERQALALMRPESVAPASRTLAMFSCSTDRSRSDAHVAAERLRQQPEPSRDRGRAEG